MQAIADWTGLSRDALREHSLLEPCFEHEDAASDARTHTVIEIIDDLNRLPIVDRQNAVFEPNGELDRATTIGGWINDTHQALTTFLTKQSEQ